jgi:hypothetical protein
LAEIVPEPTGVIDQVPPGMKAFVTVAVNCCVCPARSDAVDGETAIVGGGERVIVVTAVLVGSATLVAFTSTCCTVVMVAGAV